MSLRLEPGSIVLTPSEARALYHLAKLGPLRERHRVGDTAIYQLLTDITVAAFTAQRADVGTLPRHNAASEEREWWTIAQLARVTGRAPRTIRKDISSGTLSAVKNSNGWLIRAHHAQTYIDGHRSSS